MWVTRLNDAAPVRNARISVRDCFGNLHWQGRTGTDGIARIAKDLPKDDFDCHSEYSGYFVVARTDADMAFSFSAWGEGISPWRFNVPTGNYEGPYVAHAVLDRSLLRAGDTLSMKLFVRRQTGDGFALPARTALENRVSIRHLGTDREYEIPVTWNGAQHGEAAFAVPKDAALGTYQIIVHDSLAEHRQRPTAWRVRFGSNSSACR